MNEEDFRDVCSIMALIGLVMAYKDNHPETVLAERAYTLADAMLEARNQTKEQGIAAAKPKRVRKS